MEPTPINTILFLLGAYLIGSFPTAFLLGKWAKGIDIRDYGSGNVGATNALRVLGKKLGILCLVIDIIKGATPVVAARLLLNPDAAHTPWVIAGAGAAVILGHIYTLFLKFKGGKGVASTVGVMLAIAPLPALGAIILGVAVIYMTRWVSLGSLVIAALLPAFITVKGAIGEYLGEARALAPLTLAGLLAMMIFWSHRSNIKKLLAGNERRLGEKSDKQAQ